METIKRSNKTKERKIRIIMDDRFEKMDKLNFASFSVTESKKYKDAVKDAFYKAMSWGWEGDVINEVVLCCFVETRNTGRKFVDDIPIYEDVAIMEASYNKSVGNGQETKFFMRGEYEPAQGKFVFHS